MALADDTQQKLINVNEDVVARKVSISDLRMAYEKDELNVENHHLVGMFLASIIDDFSLTKSRLEAAKRHAQTIKSPKFDKILASLTYLYYLDSEDYAGLISWAKEPETTLRLISNNEADFETEREIFLANAEKNAQLLSSFQNVQSQGDNFRLENISNRHDRVTLRAKIGQYDANLLLDTGAGNVSLGKSLRERVGEEFTVLIANTTGGTAGNRTFKTDTGKLGNLTIGGVTFTDITATVMHSELNEIWSGTGNIEGLLGLRQILQLGESIIFDVDGNRVESLDITQTASSTFKENQLTPNVGVITSKSIIDLNFGGRTYSCLFDTGAPFTTISQNLYDDNPKSVFGKKLSKKAKRRANLPRRNKFIQVKQPIDIGGYKVGLKRIGIFPEGTKSNCYVGLDSIVAAGGATFNTKTRHLSFGVTAE